MRSASQAFLMSGHTVLTIDFETQPSLHAHRPCPCTFNSRIAAGPYRHRLHAQKL